MDFGDIFTDIIGTTLPGFDTTFNIILFGDFYVTFTTIRFMFWDVELWDLLGLSRLFKKYDISLMENDYIYQY